MSYIIRRAERKDAATIYRFVCELADFEKALDQVQTTEDGLAEAIFGPNSVTEGLIAEVDGKPAGFALYYFSFSTWQGRNGIYLEDLYVSPEFRGSGLGRALMQSVAQVGIERGCGRMEWSVLDWNENAIRVYDGVGGKPQSEWIRYRLEDASLTNFADDKAC
ncbi:GNAT family N-acetyltransferase [Martelella mediterranea]|uniref:Ribosomal protein S18 acetylase RimI-like enzyme n=1 Tax=Martelella mediterranea TaxID=293089 RepID=A0A4R3NRP4_9HYPH|nr:GNAT family N-acetyltransferase [Martelella mediterranea]TCT37882.1 ribosomal protein S18 acetylase RimI-like enzyme [Martelella mediterranea]